MTTRTTIRLRSGNRMPPIGLGTWQLNKDTASTVTDALLLGYPMIDTSGDYGTQRGVGRGIERVGVERSAVYVISKVEETDDAYRATRKNLGELRLEYADLMLIHRPPQTGPGRKLWKGLARARDEGLVRDIGVSNYSMEQLGALMAAVGEAPAVNQIEWSPFGHRDEMQRYCEGQGIVIQAYSPLTRGERLGDAVLMDMGRAYGKTPAQILLRWSIQRGTVPLPKANRLEHLREDLDVFGFAIAADDMRTLSALNEQYSALGSLPYV